MSETRTLPIPATHRQFTIKSGGQEVARTEQLLSVSVSKQANRISSARLVYVDGVAASGDFPLGNADTFAPGREVEILAGPPEAPVSVFKGIVVRQSMKARANAASQLIVYCQHPAVKMTVGRKSAYYHDRTDGEIIEELLRRARLTAEVEATSVRHVQQVQYGCTDWDFLLIRAEANGRLVFTEAGKVIVRKPAMTGSPVCTLHFGSTVLELDAEIDARSQFTAVRGISWDPARQERIEKDGADPGVNGPGNFVPNDLAGLAGLERYEVRHSALGGDEAQAWADAQFLMSRLAKVAGRVKCEGIATINPGDIVTLDGVGARCSGDVFVVGVRHDCDLVQGWKTHVQWGDIPHWPANEPPVSEPPAGALLAAVNGLQIGVVVSNDDPAGEFRVRVRMPLISADQDGTWARVAAPDAGAERGFFWRPEIGDEVLLGFLHEDPRHPVVLGMLHSSAKAAPLTPSDDNHEKAIQTRSKLRLHFNDEKKRVELKTPAGNEILLNETDKTLEIRDQNGNELKMTEDGISLSSPKKIAIKAGTEFQAESGTGFAAKGGTTMKVSGTSSAELSSSATTSVKGSMVQIN